MWRKAIVIGGALWLSGCASTSDEGSACAEPSSFEQAWQTANAASASHNAVEPHASCTLDNQLAMLDSGSAETRLYIGEGLLQAGAYQPAVYWLEQADSLEAFAVLLDLHAPHGALADDAAFLRYQVQNAQLQQRFGEAVDYPQTGPAQALYVSAERAVLLDEPQQQAGVVEALSQDERVFLIDVIVLEDTEDYWVEAYYPDTLQLGWLPAESLDRLRVGPRRELDMVLSEQGRNFSQQILFGGVIALMDVGRLVALEGGDFFQGAEHQRDNSRALIQALGEQLDACQQAQSQVQTQFEHYLMDEGSAPTPNDVPLWQELDEALNALTSRGDYDAHLQSAIVEDAWRYFRIRLRSPVEQRLCFSLPNAAQDPDLAEPSCQAVTKLQQCYNQITSILNAS